MEDSEFANRLRLEKEKLTNDEANLLYRIIFITSMILDKNNIRYTIEGGTLLGAVRNGGLIPHDNDGDFDVLQTDIIKILDSDIKLEFKKYNLEIIVTPGWGLQISDESSPELDPDLWNLDDILKEGDINYYNIVKKHVNNKTSWTSKWPFLDLISIKFDSGTNKYILAQSIALNDYPNYYLTKEDWENSFDKIKFGDLDLWTIGGHENRIKYLDRNYPNWDNEIVMIMDHRKNVYFDKPIRVKLS
jgi:hypothetical protein